MIHISLNQIRRELMYYLESDAYSFSVSQIMKNPAIQCYILKGFSVDSNKKEILFPTLEKVVNYASNINIIESRQMEILNDKFRASIYIPGESSMMMSIIIPSLVKNDTPEEFKLIYQRVESGMKKLDLRFIYADMMDRVEKDLESTGYHHILTYEPILNRLETSFLYDKNNNCIWCDDANDLMELAVTTGIIEESDYEDFLAKVHFNISLKNEE